MISARNKGFPACLFSWPRKKYLRRTVWKGPHTKHLLPFPIIHHTGTATRTRDRYEKAASTLGGTAPLQRHPFDQQAAPFRRSIRIMAIIQRQKTSDRPYAVLFGVSAVFMQDVRPRWVLVSSWSRDPWCCCACSSFSGLRTHVF